MNIDHSADEFRPRQIYQQVAERIRSSILSGAFPAGSRLPSERELAQRLGVQPPCGAGSHWGAAKPGFGGHSPWLGHLRHGPGWRMRATRRPQAAVRLSPLSILDVRLLFEPALARRAARGGKRDAAAEEYLLRMSEVRDLSDPQQQALWSECDRLFHRQIALMGGDALWVRNGRRNRPQHGPAPVAQAVRRRHLRPRAHPPVRGRAPADLRGHHHGRRRTPPLFWWSAICSACGARTSPARIGRVRGCSLPAPRTCRSSRAALFQCRPGAG